ncbi:MAG TPA: 50S ribosomal protein L13 [Candidatus Paceibacterota bacterium]|jgi:large subunit ribosomal protein L13|nr:50S ribosomal protein L13 [Candidatus Paceibacterota bacterium]
MKHVIDATNKKVGRVATQAATLLMGKNTAAFVRNAAPEVEVHIINTSKASIDEKKAVQKKYVRFSGYPGGLKETPLRRMAEEKGYSEVFRKAVKGMLPKNKLQAVMLKNLTISE